jgi:hypothetical protein
VSEVYVRGAGGVDVDARLAWQWVARLLLASLAALTVVLVVGAIRQDVAARRLIAHGVPVTARVTGCVGLASGTGITVYGWTCRASFDVGTHQYDEVLGHTSHRFATGTAVAARVVPGQPASLALAQSRSDWRPFLPAAATGLLAGAVLLVSAAARRSPRTGRSAAASRPRSGCPCPSARQGLPELQR